MTLFSPTSIAIIGASSTEGKVGHDILKNLVTQGYKGKIYPINPKGGEILGKTAYASVTDVPSDIDVAIIVIPGKFVPSALEECGQKGIQNAVIISAGFSEVHTEEGNKLEEEVVAIVKKYNMQLVGPNCLGILNPSIGMNASFAKQLPMAGNIALMSQSGAMAVAIMDASPALHIGYSLVASIGNKATMDECDFLEICAQDENTEVIGFYLESILDGKRFLEVANRVSKTKHIVVLKSGVSEHGKTAASSHTGALAGNDAAIDAACKQTGIHRAHSAAELLDLVRVLSAQPTLATPRVAIITNAGGPGILATDAAEIYGLELPSFERSTLEKLQPQLPAAAGLVNPIDVIGDAGTERYKAALEACAHDPNIDGVCIILTPQVSTPCEDIAQMICDVSKKYPLMPFVTSFMGSDSVADPRKTLQNHGIPTFETPERAIRALSALVGIRDSRFGQEKRSEVRSPKSDSQKNPKSSTMLAGHHGLLPEDTSKELFKMYGLDMPGQGLATTPDEAVKIANELGYPVVAKISSPQILHKTDVGGIMVNLKSDSDVRSAFKTILANVQRDQKPDANLEIKGILIQQFLPIGNEFIIGSIKDPSFGSMIMVGLGGIYTELFKDTSFRIAPVSLEESYEMLQELTSWKLLLGMRGAAQADIDALAEIVQKISILVAENPEIIELDLNPVLVGESGVVIADVKVVVA